MFDELTYMFGSMGRSIDGVIRTKQITDAIHDRNRKNHEKSQQKRQRNEQQIAKDVNSLMQTPTLQQAVSETPFTERRMTEVANSMNLSQPYSPNIKDQNMLNDIEYLW